MAVLALPSVPAITSAFLLKLTTSLDDLLWLSPFLSLSPSVQNKLKHSVVYFIICVVVTMIAFVFGTSLLALTSRTGGDDAEGGGYWNPERFLSVFSASVLFYIARNDYVEWKEENHEEKKKKEEGARGDEAGPSSRTIADGNHASETTMEMPSRRSSESKQLRARRKGASKPGDTEAGECSGSSFDDEDSGDKDSDDEEVRAKIKEASKSLRRFITVCVMGTLDDMIVFSAFVAGGAGSNVRDASADGMKHSYLALFIGTTFAALLIVTVSWFFSEIECFKRLVKKIPMWALLTGIAVYILFMGLI
mmetsp:Transcript_7005/g.17119  ORF Transcript_7005/g.17119 Transcript_7005/m.17119 type:complete len:307 (+) Transcript_7005:214-1134(+)|eukprot:CAMPEP_0197179456 /NCGR_PEP_ID=MMETSP1423-20130617/4396_1 /TAXON_ID=476441 /ORGANISM="Pseudo-nitzschia heimii, Strain UNC1101" /LENGTH=306 /DNA_ID=CAMNT_0042629367 /DNA_START=134 /DNA_END=1054 /DNA_ORIENTATION=+